MIIPAQNFSFALQSQDGQTHARHGRVVTRAGAFETPAFMPVGTIGTVKGIVVDRLRDLGVEIVLSNTYHLALRPGAEVVAELGGLHKFMGWNGPILTDSGGFQVFSLAQMGKISEQQATFRSHIDGSLVELSPERAMEIQRLLGSDIAMVLDHVVALPNEQEVIRDAMQRSLRWARRSRNAARDPSQAVFGIVQGGLDEALRLESCAGLVEIGFDGYSIGGLSVGESPDEMYRVLDFTVPALPVDCPRYLMGVGRPQDLLEAIARGVDMFDCVIPTRNGRNAQAFTDSGPVRLRNRKHERDTRPLDENCPCPACQHSVGYLRHLFQANEMLGPILLSAHNVCYYERLLSAARAAIDAGRFHEFSREKLLGWQGQAIAKLD
ncbi:MAG: tRNA guanosine(34) transglycosylase Tgt [Planctomycetales bacterium]|nr:tRNA guanosine(34) transglycosylase Tgt [Planctomycetales bacterium]